jgi:Cys-tRNA(Pro)/Cys-tRNA(Cys) deacylase
MRINNVTRLLDSKKVKYQTFEMPEEKISALDTAALLQVSAELIYKSIVFLRNSPKTKPLLAVIPATHEVDAKLLAKAVGEKKVKPATLTEAETLTGLKAGGISPLALINKGFQIFLALPAADLDEIHVSGGQLGLNIRLKVKDLVKLTGARIAPISSILEEQH